MGLALRLYEQLSEATDEWARFRLIADAIGELEDSWPRPGEVARAGDVRESELRLQRAIEVVRKEIQEVELRLQQEIGEVRKEIKQVELQVQHVRVELKTTEANLRGAIHRQTLWVVGAVGSVVGLVRLLDWLLASA